MIEGPLPTCHKIFENTRRCNYVTKTDASKAGKLKHFKFHEIKMKPDQSVEILFENIEELKISECGRRQTLSLCVHYKRRQQQKQLFSLQNFLGEFFISHPRSPCPKVATPATKNINNFFRVIQKRI